VHSLYEAVDGKPIMFVDPLGLVCGSTWTDPFVPDKPGGFDFTACCQQHDDCYGNCEERPAKEECDEAFYWCMVGVCDDSHPEGGKEWWKCFGYAVTYYAAVLFAGDGAFEAARDQCDDCQ